MGKTISVTQKQKNITNVQKYHDMGYTGKGIRVLCHEDSNHGENTMYVLKQIAPDAEIIYASVSQKITSGKLVNYSWTIDGKKYTFDEMMREFHPDIISCSLHSRQKCSEREAIVQPYIDSGELIICTCAGNMDKEGVFSMYPNALTIGACRFTNSDTDDIGLAPISGRDEDKLSISYVGFMWNFSGTSFSTPFVAGQIALFMQRFGKMSQKKLQEVLKPYCMDLGEPGKDNCFGDGLIILPEELDLKEFEEMNFTDIENDRYSKEAIEWAYNSGLINGYPDGSFKPEEPLSREQMCVILHRAHQKGMI